MLCQLIIRFVERIVERPLILVIVFCHNRRHYFEDNNRLHILGWGRE